MSTQIELEGERVRLAPVAVGDRDAIIAIRSTDEVRRRWRGDDLGAEFDEDLDDDELVQLTIRTRSGTIIGMIQFSEVEEPEYRHATVDIYIDPAVHRNGYASESIRLLVDHLFDDCGHHRVTIDPVADNIAAINCYRGVGFQPVGVMRSYEKQSDGSWADGLLMEMLDSDRTR